MIHTKEGGMVRKKIICRMGPGGGGTASIPVFALEGRADSRAGWAWTVSRGSTEAELYLMLQRPSFTLQRVARADMSGGKWC